MATVEGITGEQLGMPSLLKKGAVTTAGVVRHGCWYQADKAG